MECFLWCFFCFNKKWISWNSSHEVIYLHLIITFLSHLYSDEMLITAEFTSRETGCSYFLFTCINRAEHKKLVLLWMYGRKQKQSSSTVHQWQISKWIVKMCVMVYFKIIGKRGGWSFSRKQNEDMSTFISFFLQLACFLPVSRSREFTLGTGWTIHCIGSTKDIHYLEPEGKWIKAAIHNVDFLWVHHYSLPNLLKKKVFTLSVKYLDSKSGWSRKYENNVVPPFVM